MRPGVLLPGPLDIVGDVHGELAALQALLSQLGYKPDGSHPDGRHLIFVGDLCDRGPDSPGVIRLVANLVAAGRAQCLLGNHELNLLRGSLKDANGWFFAIDHDRDKGKFTGCQQATAAERTAFHQFFASLPLALERADLRVVHAAWQAESLAALDKAHHAHTVLDIYSQHEDASKRWARQAGVAADAEQEEKEWGPFLSSGDKLVPLLAATGTLDEYGQMSNPVRVVTSGVERLAKASFFASGKWRMVDRVAWWQDYQDPVPVLFGHYWRWASPNGAALYSRGEQDLFAGLAGNQWAGPRRNAFCLDFSVGVRYRERPLKAGQNYQGRLAAVRWPERELVFDNGEHLPLIP